MNSLDEIKDILWLYSTHERQPFQADEAFANLNGFGALVIDGLIWGLQQDDSGLKLTVLQLLQEHFADAKRALAAVRSLISDEEDRLVRVTAINTLHVMRDTSNDILPLLKQKLESRDDLERLFAAANLWRICRSEDAYFVLRREAAGDGDDPLTEMARGILEDGV